MGLDAMILVYLMLSFKPVFLLSSWLAGVLPPLASVISSEMDMWAKAVHKTQIPEFFLKLMVPEPAVPGSSANSCICQGNKKDHLF